VTAPHEKHDQQQREQQKRRRAEDGSGSKRDLEFPPAPEALPFSVYDNHTHFDIADGDTHVSVSEQLEKAALVGVVGVVGVVEGGWVVGEAARGRGAAAKARTVPDCHCSVDGCAQRGGCAAGHWVHSKKPQKPKTLTLLRPNKQNITQLLFIQLRCRVV
jgi:hypothetical protein